MEITPAMIAAFRADPLLKAFSNATTWPDELIAAALVEADAETGSIRWGAFELAPANFKWRGMRYYAAAWLASNFGDSGSVASEARLNVASKSIGDESVTYRVPQMMNAGTDWLTYTVYGQQFYRLKLRAGMGAIVV